MGGALLSIRRLSAGGKPVFVAQQGAFQGSYYVYTDGVNSGGNSSLPIQTAETIRQPFLSVHQSAGAGSKLIVRLNGEARAVNQTGTVGNDTGSTGFVVGNREDVGAAMFPWGGDIAEVLVYDRVLTPAELEQAERYLATRYNLPAQQNRALPAKPARESVAEDRKLIVELCLTALCREPREEELKTALDHIAAAENRRQGLEDVFWAVLNSKEFLFRP
jgi:hypothetical protein